MKKRVLVIGELNPDIIVSGLLDFPELGKEILAHGLYTVLGSSSAICAAGLHRLGARVDFLGKVGTDYYGDLAIDQLRRLGVGIGRILRDRVMRTGVTISLTYPQDRSMITYMGCIPHLSLDDINTSILRRYDHLHVGSYFLQRGLHPGLKQLFLQAHRDALTTSLDCGHDPDEQWGGDHLMDVLDEVDIFFPNQSEAMSITGTDSPEQALRALSKPGRQIVVKCGPQGSMTLRDTQVVQVPGFVVDVKDTTGAGDSFNSGFIYAYIGQDMSLENALRFANACGAMSTTGFGGTASQPTADEVYAFMEEPGR